MTVFVPSNVTVGVATGSKFVQLGGRTLTASMKAVLSPPLMSVLVFVPRNSMV